MSDELKENLKLIHLQLELEQIGFDAKGDLVRIPDPKPDPEEVYRFFLARFPDGVVRYFRPDVSDVLRDPLGVIPAETVLSDPEAVKKILGAVSPCRNCFNGRTYVFPVDIKEEPDAKVVLVDSTRSAYGILLEGKVISQCESVRENKFSGEAWIETQPEHRRHGYGRKVALAWGRALSKKGKIPFYSHLNDNRASEALARSLGLPEAFSAAGYV